MLETKDLEAIAKIVTDIVDTRVTKTEAFLLEEIDRTQRNLQNKIDTLQKDVDELTQYYRIKKLEDNNNALLFHMVFDLQKDMTELKKKCPLYNQKALLPQSE